MARGLRSPTLLRINDDHTDGPFDLPDAHRLISSAPLLVDPTICRDDADEPKAFHGMGL